MTVDDLQILLDYHYWARDRVLDAVDRLTPEQFTRDLGNSFPSVRDTVVHVYAAEWIWCSRWEGQSPAAMPDPKGFPDPGSIRETMRALEARVRAALAAQAGDGIERPVSYHTLDGRPQSQPFWQQFHHMVNHGTYHRGQLTTMLRQLGAKPAASMDMIVFYRERAAESAS